MNFEIATSLPLRKNFTYHIPETQRQFHSIDALIGMRVRIPVGTRTTDGVIIGETKAALEGSIKPIHELLPYCKIDPHHLEFYRWLSEYYTYPLGLTLHDCIPQLWGLAPKKESSNTADKSVSDADEIKLTSEQQHAVDSINASIQNKEFRTFLLDGVTGSGKTEVYFHCIARALELNQSALLLVPEIALTPQLLDRFNRFFESRGIVYHSGLTPKKKHQSLWELKKRADQGIPFVLIGTRSALVLPLDFKLIIVDEEHDASYKQNDHLRYHARDVAIMKGHLGSFPVILGSATPSLETLERTQASSERRIEHLRLTRRANESLLPALHIIDLKIHKSASMISEPLIDEIQKNLERKEQTILFLNRRGFSPSIICESCAHIYKCPQCDLSLTYSKTKNLLCCHYCDHQERTPLECGACTQPTLRAIGSGTERIEEEITELFPQARVARFDRDTVRTHTHLHTILSELHAGSIDILIGTQMIAKGHHFPQVTLVGILLADASLHFPDFRSFERTYQLLTQVSGRAGRGTQPGRVLIQTYQPNHAALRAVVEQNRDLWFHEDRAFRETHLYPPFTRLAIVHFESRDLSVLQKNAHSLKNRCPKVEGLDVLGPIPSPLARVGGYHRMQLLLKCIDSKLLHRYVNQVMLPFFDHHNKIRAWVDFDPQQLL